MDYLKTFKEMISLRGLTEHTVTSYSTYIHAYLDYLDKIIHKRPEDVSWQELRDYIFYIKKQRGLSDRTINHCISQLRFFTLYVLHKPWDHYQLPMRKFDYYIPYVPTKEEAYYFISSMTNPKPKAMVALLYSAGLRIGEVCRLKYKDIERTNMRIYIQQSKNRCDRYALLSPYALELLTQYWIDSGKPNKKYLFPKQYGADKPIDTFYLSRHMKAHEERLGWEHRLTCHTFRHAFGTHLYESGTDLLTIKKLLGHKSLTSTVIYVQLAKNTFSEVVSPLDIMNGTNHG